MSKFVCIDPNWAIPIKNYIRQFAQRRAINEVLQSKDSTLR